MDAQILVLTGPPCSGKSTVRRLLADTRVAIAVDDVFDLLLPNSDRNRRDRMLGYDAAHAMARTAAAHGRSAVLECTYARREQRESLAVSLGAFPIQVVEFAVTPDVAVQRFRQRNQHDDLTENLVVERVGQFPYSVLACGVDSVSNSAEVIASRITEWLDTAPRPIALQQWAAAGIEWR